MDEVHAHQDTEDQVFGDVVALAWSAPWQWLGKGWRDMRASWKLSGFFGACFLGMAMVLVEVFRHSPEYTISILSGCLLVGPFLALGLYEISRQLEQGRRATLAQVLLCWQPHLASMGLLLLVLMVLELLWGRASLVVFAVFFNTGLPSDASVLEALFNPDNWQFVLIYLLVAGVFATLVFCSMVVSIPMILHRDTDAISAAITSFRVVLENPGVMLGWALLIVVLLGLALLPFGLGLLVVGPLLGHASWHAYRAAVHWPPANHP